MDGELEEEDLPLYHRPRVQAWAASSRGSLPRPLLGSSERFAMLEDAQLIEKDAGVLYDKIKVLRKEAELLMEKAYHKRVICAPIRSLPLEILNRILLLATPDNFAFHVSQCVAHPLSTVSKAWYDIINSTPEFYSRINIHVRIGIPYLQELEDAAKRLPSWLSKARSTGLYIRFFHADESLYSAGPLPAMWMMLLSLVGNWQDLSYYGAVPFIHQFWDKVDSARSLKFVSLTVGSNSLHLDRSRNDPLVSNTFPCSPRLPRLQHLLLSGHLPRDFMARQITSITSLQTLTLRGSATSCLTEDRLLGFGASFPSLTKLRLEDVITGLEPVSAVLSGFRQLQHFELGELMGADTMPLSALNRCRTLKTLRLRFSAFHLNDKCEQLPSVERLELEFTRLSRDPEKDKALFTLLPSLKFLKVSPADTYQQGAICDARGLLNELLVWEDSAKLPTCPHLAEFYIERATISSCDIACLIADRTFDATPTALGFLEDNCRGTHKYVHGQHRPTRHTKWKPTCLLTTSKCPGIPDMVNAGLEALVDECKSGKLILDDGEEGLECASDCGCDCGDEACSCCEHQGASDGDSDGIYDI